MVRLRPYSSDHARGDCDGPKGRILKHLPATFLALVVTGLCAAAELPLVKVLSTGGTIASRYDPVPPPEAVMKSAMA